jgi:hypothetical protein
MIRIFMEKPILHFLQCLGIISTRITAVRKGARVPLKNTAGKGLRQRRILQTEGGQVSLRLRIGPGTGVRLTLSSVEFRVSKLS